MNCTFVSGFIPDWTCLSFDVLGVSLHELLLRTVNNERISFPNDCCWIDCSFSFFIINLFSFVSPKQFIGSVMAVRVLPRNL